MVVVMSQKQHIIDAISILGSEAKLAAACGYSQAAVSKAKHSGRVSAEMAVAIERATDGAIPRSDFRPDLWGAPSYVVPYRQRSAP